MSNLFTDIPTELSEEVFQVLAENGQTRIERIISTGQSSAEGFWYDQDENEWVIVLQGSAQIEFIDGRVCVLAKGDYLNIPAHEKHRVAWTEQDAETIWLAVLY